MALGIYKICSTKGWFKYAKDKDTIRRGVRLAAMEYCFDNRLELVDCLAKETVDSVVQMIGGVVC